MAPTFVSASTSSDGAQVNLTYNEVLSTNTAPSTAFNVNVDGSAAVVALVTTSSSDIQLGLATSILPGQSVSVSYTAPTATPGKANLAIQNTAGDDAASLSATTVTNNSTVPGNASINFSESGIASGGGGSPAIASTDLNNDRLADLVVADNRSGLESINVLLGNGSGGFTPASTQATGGEPTSMTANDFNQDGNNDLAISNYMPNKNISILYGNGSGGFLPSVSTVSSSRPQDKPRSITSADFNRDGTIDLAWTNDDTSNSNANGNVAVSLNNGTNTPFSGITASYTIGVNPYDLIATDLNGDGILDLTAANSPSSGNGSISVLLGNGDGSFQSAVDITVGTRPRYFASGDFNRDGKQDLALSQSGNDNNLSILINNGSGTTFSRSTIPFGNETAPRDVIAADFNADSKLDLAVTTLQGDGISVLLGNGNGSFMTRKAFAAGDGPAFATSADFNRDDLPDLAVANSNTGGTSSISLLLNRTPIERPSIGDDDGEPESDHVPSGVAVQISDSDGDGLREAIKDRQGNWIDGNRDGLTDADQQRVTGLRLIGDGGINRHYGAVALADGLFLNNTRCNLPSPAGIFSLSSRQGDFIKVQSPTGISNSFIGSVSFRVSGIDAIGQPGAGSNAVATVHLPIGLQQNPNTYYSFNYLTNQFEDYTDSRGNRLYSYVGRNSDGRVDAVELTLIDGDLRWDRDGIINGSFEAQGFAARVDEATKDVLISRNLSGSEPSNGQISDRVSINGSTTYHNDSILLGGRNRQRLTPPPSVSQTIIKDALGSSSGMTLSTQPSALNSEPLVTSPADSNLPWLSALDLGAQSWSI